MLDRERFRTQADARLAIFDFIEGWYNPRRRHSALDYLSPMIYERDLDSSSPSTEPGQLQKRGVRFRNQDFWLGAAPPRLCV